MAPGCFMGDELLRRALTRLSPERRQVIDLVYYHEKSVDEVAQILDVPPATVKTRMFYARKKLAELVQGRLRKSGDGLLRRKDLARVGSGTLENKPVVRSPQLTGEANGCFYTRC
jgi:predicted DNA-binding protein (UPF0251 family)